MMQQLEHALGLLAERAEPLSTDALVGRLEAQLATDRAALDTDTSSEPAMPTVPTVHDRLGTARRRSPWRGPLIAAGTAAAILVIVSLSMLLVGDDSGDAVIQPTPTTTTVAEATTTLPSTTVAPPNTTTMISVPSPTPPFTMPSEILPASDGPFEWRWEPQLDSVREVPDVTTLIQGAECYGSGGNQVPSAAVDFDGSRIDFTLGHLSTPDIVITDEAGTSTEVGNPFGADAWLCGVAANDSILLAVGSGVFWSGDGITWHGIEAFEEHVGSKWNSELLWAAAGPEGYIVFGEDPAHDSERLAWFSEDLQSWYVIPLEAPTKDVAGWDWVGPTGVAIGNKPIIVVWDGAWVGTRP